MTRMRASMLIVITAAIVALTNASTVVTPAQAGGWSPTPGALFNVPRSTIERQTRLERAVIAAINHARPRSTIRMTMFSFDRMQVADALIKAHRQRRVAVQVLVNGHETPRAQRKLRRVLGHNRKRASFFYQCVSSCRGDGDVNHSKFILFSATGTARNVVMLGSLNMKLNGVRNQFNDLLTTNGNTKLYSSLDMVFGQMKLDRIAKPSFLDILIGSPMELFVMPFPRTQATPKTRWTPDRDPIVRLLKPIRCGGASTPSGRTVVRVNMHAWDGSRGAMLANRFLQLFRDGCDVKIQVGFIGGQVRGILLTPTARGRMPVRSTGYDTDEDGEIDLYSHEKILLVHGNYNGAPGQNMVVTGSSNYQDGGQYGDEIILRLFNGRIYKQYISNWDWSWKYHTHGIA
jgi:phosphatidylserine/phosphatidylglycerophosphate/cardiolipin synthase-like enzyme